MAKWLSFDERKDYAHEIIKNARKQRYPAFLARFSSYENYKVRLRNLLYSSAGGKKKGKAFIAIWAPCIVFLGAVLLYHFNQSPVAVTFTNACFAGESQRKTIRMNYPPGQNEADYYYEEYMDGYWWRGTLLAEKTRAISGRLVEVTFSGYLYKCEE